MCGGSMAITDIKVEDNKKLKDIETEDGKIFIRLRISEEKSILITKEIIELELTNQS